jgi:hypothetical protein
MMRAARLTSVPKKSLSRRCTTPRCRPQRTRSAMPAVASGSRSARCSMTVARSAAPGSPKTACRPSPVVLTTVPPCAATAACDSTSCRASASRMVFGCSSQRRVLPSMSLKRKVTALPDCSGMDNSYPPRASAARRRPERATQPDAAVVNTVPVRGSGLCLGRCRRTAFRAGSDVHQTADRVDVSLRHAPDLEEVADCLETAVDGSVIDDRLGFDGRPSAAARQAGPGSPN